MLTLLLLMSLKHWQAGMSTGLDYQCWWLANSAIGYYTIAVNCVGIAITFCSELCRLLSHENETNTTTIIQQHNLLTLHTDNVQLLFIGTYVAIWMPTSTAIPN